MERSAATDCSSRGCFAAKVSGVVEMSAPGRSERSAAQARVSGDNVRFRPEVDMGQRGADRGQSVRARVAFDHYAFLLVCAATALAMAVVLAYWIIRPSFLADPSAPNVARIAGSAIAALLLSLCGARMLIKRAFRPRTIALFIGLSVVVGFVWLFAVKEPAFYLLHLAEKKHHAETVELASPTAWSKSCNRGRLDFPSLALTARFLCRVPDQVTAVMPRAGLVRLSGEASRFGMTADNVEVVEAL